MSARVRYFELAAHPLFSARGKPGGEEGRGGEGRGGEGGEGRDGRGGQVRREEEGKGERVGRGEKEGHCRAVIVDEGDSHVTVRGAGGH